MSKLSKFKTKISADEAAILLSSLIEEDVSSEDLEIIYTNGWLTASHNCIATIVELTPLLDPEQHAAQVAIGRYHMQPGADCGICFGVDLPLDQVDINGHGRAYTLRDEDGGFYALRDNQTGQYLGDSNDDFLYFEDCGLSPHDIYELADHANKSGPMTNSKIRIIENLNCICGERLYNFTPGDHRPNIQTVPMEARPAAESPSLTLAVAALVEIITSDSPKKRNQASLIEEILDKYELRGLSKSNLEKMFSQANRKLTEAKSQS